MQQLPILIGFFLAGTAGTVVLGLVSRWVDRKVTARVQFRQGPPVLQPLYDVMKLLGKEVVVPERARGTGFLLAPLLGFAAVSVAAALLWYTAVRPEGVFIGDLVVVLYILVLPSLAIILGGAASGSPHATVGASREMKLMISYELPLVLAVVAVLVGTGTHTFRLGDLAAYQSQNGAAALHWYGAIALVVAFFCMQAKLGLVPFDIPEAETELMSGPLVEYSGAPLAVFYLTRAMLLAVMPLFLITVFLGGIHLAFPGVFLSIVQYVVLLVLIVVVRNTNPRIRIDHAVKFFWYILTPAALVSLLLAYAGL
ncbi:MAG: complex I subunit 1 family protein [Gemmatimonadota bacterium]